MYNIIIWVHVSTSVAASLLVGFDFSGDLAVVVDDGESTGLGAGSTNNRRDAGCDVNAMKWMGVNTFCTSHYPYAEELLELCDQEGIVVISESPAMWLRTQNYLNETLEHHIEAMTELVQRDKNRPSVVM